MKQLRNIAYKILGLHAYLRVISKIYITCTSLGLWKKKYPELFYLDTIIKPGSTCIDIGANLGYYSSRMAKLTGKTGKVYAIEPIPLFGKIWKKNVCPTHNPQAELLAFALGEKTRIVQMGIPEKNGRIHHGMTKIASTAKETYVHYFNVEMRNPDELFANLKRLDFIKCDVEGYESMVFSNFTQTISKFKPLVQSELGGDENRKTVIQLFESLGYSCTILQNGKLQKIDLEDAMKVSQDFYFVPKS